MGLLQRHLPPSAISTASADGKNLTKRLVLVQVVLQSIITLSRRLRVYVYVLPASIASPRLDSTRGEWTHCALLPTHSFGLGQPATIHHI